MVTTNDQKPVYAFKGGAEGAMERLESKLFERLRAEVKEGLKSVDEAISETKEWRAEMDAFRQAYEDERRKMQVPGSAQGYNFGRVAQAVNAGGQDHHYQRYAPNEWEASQAYAQATTPDGSGGFWIPGEARDDLMIELVRPKSVALALGAQQMNFTSTPVEIPREQGTPLSPTTKSENATLDSQDVGAGQLTMNPRLTGLIVKGSRRFFEMGAAADPFIRRILAREMRIKIDTWVLKGAGGSQPIGILEAADVNSVSFSGLTATEYAVYPKLVEMQSKPLEVGNHEVLESPGWAICAKAERAARLIKSEDSSTAQDHGDIARAVLADSRADRLLGDPFRATTILASTAAGELIYGDWFEVVIGTWRGMQIESTESGGTSFESHQRWLKATQEMDVGLWHPTAFSVTNDWDLNSF